MQSIRQETRADMLTLHEHMKKEGPDTGIIAQLLLACYSRRGNIELSEIKKIDPSVMPAFLRLLGTWVKPEKQAHIVAVLGQDACDELMDIMFQFS